MTLTTRRLHLLLPAALLSCAGQSDYLRAPDLFTGLAGSNITPSQTVIHASPDAVWRALPRVYQAMGYPAGPARGTSQRIMTTPELRIQGRLYEGQRNSDYLNCGESMTGDRADSHLIEFVIATRIRTADAGGTLVETIVEGTATDRSTNTAPVRCTGTGRLEREIVIRLRLEVGG